MSKSSTHSTANVGYATRLSQLLPTETTYHDDMFVRFGNLLVEGRTRLCGIGSPKIHIVSTTRGEVVVRLSVTEVRYWPKWESGDWDNE